MSTPHPNSPTGYLRNCIVYVDIDGNQRYTSGDPAGLTSMSSQWTINLLNSQKSYDLFVQPSSQVEVSLVN